MYIKKKLLVHNPHHNVEDKVCLIFDSFPIRKYTPSSEPAAVRTQKKGAFRGRQQIQFPTIDRNCHQDDSSRILRTQACLNNAPPWCWNEARPPLEPATTHNMQLSTLNQRKAGPASIPAASACHSAQHETQHTAPRHVSTMRHHGVVMRPVLLFLVLLTRVKLPRWNLLQRTTCNSAHLTKERPGRPPFLLHQPATAHNMKLSTLHPGMSQQCATMVL